MGHRGPAALGSARKEIFIYFFLFQMKSDLL
jgi:hypothetical protein